MSAAPQRLFTRSRCAKLDSVVSWRREIGRVYRAVRRGDIPPDIGTKLAFIGRVGSQLVQIEEELKAAHAIERRLADIAGRPAIALDQADPQPVALEHVDAPPVADPLQIEAA